MKPERAVSRETAYVSLVTVALSLVMEAVFVAIRRWDMTVLFGNLLGAFAAVLNFFLMGLGIQKIVSGGEKKPENKIRLYMTLRMLMLAAFLVLGAVLKCFNLFAVMIPLFFPTIGIYVQKFVLKKKGGAEGSGDAPEPPAESGEAGTRAAEPEDDEEDDEPDFGSGEV